MYGTRKRGFSSPAHQRSLGCDCSGKGALSEPSSVFDFTESPVEFQKSVRSPRKRLLQNASIPRLRNFETEGYFKEAPEEQRPRWTHEKQPERRQSLSPTPKKQKSGSTQLELGELSKEKNASPKKTTVPDNLSDLFEGLPQSPRKSTLDIRTVNIISSEEPEPQIPKVALEPPSIPTVDIDGQSVLSPPKPHKSPRNYGIRRSYRAEQNSDNESDELDAEPVSTNLQPSLDLKVSGLNNRYDQEIEFMAETVSSARSPLSAKRTALLETARKGAMDAKIMDRLVLRGVEDLAVGIEAAGNDLILVSAWIYLATPMKKEPPLDFTRNAIELFLPVSGTLRKHIERQAKLTKIDQLALDEFLDHVPIASPRELALDYLLHRDHHVLVKLCTQKILKLVIDAAQLGNEKSMLLVEMLVDQLRPLAGFDKIDHLVKSAIVEKTDSLSICLRLAIVLTAETESQLSDQALVVPLLELVRRSYILSGNMASSQDQETGLFALGLLFNLQEHVSWPENAKPLFEELLQSVKIEQNLQNATRVHAIGYFCLLVDTATETVRTGLETFRAAVGGGSQSIKARIEAKLSQMC